jgi:hypothetical protein
LGKEKGGFYSNTVQSWPALRDVHLQGQHSWIYTFRAALDSAIPKAGCVRVCFATAAGITAVEWGSFSGA